MDRVEEVLEEGWLFDYLMPVLCFHPEEGGSTFLTKHVGLEVMLYTCTAIPNFKNTQFTNFCYNEVC
jgi:hypothetical protein